MSTVEASANFQPWTAYIEGRSVTVLQPLRAGGEANIYKTSDGDIVKVRQLPQIGQLAVEGPCGLSKPDVSQYQTLDLATLEPAVTDSRHEASVLRRLGKHPNIIPVYIAGIDTAEYNFHYLCMPRYECSLLDDLEAYGPFSIPETVKVIKQLASALQHAHDRGIIHRDVKPENILLDADGNAVLSDFGMAIDFQEQQEPKGTVTYAAPEQEQGRAVPASDGFSLALVAYEMLTGVPEFEYDGRMDTNAWGQAVLRRHALGIIHPFAIRTGRANNSQQLDALESVVLAELDKDPQTRYVSVQSFAEALETAAFLFDPDKLHALRTYPEAARRAEIQSLVAEAANKKQSGQLIPAIQLLEEAYNLDPANVAVLDLTAQTLLALNFHDIAADIAMMIIEIPAKCEQDLIVQSKAHRYLGHVAEADQCMRQVKARTPAKSGKAELPHVGSLNNKAARVVRQLTAIGILR